MGLLDVLRAALADAPPVTEEDGKLRIHVLFSRPFPVRSLYPLAHLNPSDMATATAEAVEVWQEHVMITAAWEGADDSEKLAYALELYVYTLPQQRAALVYVSKLDTTGFGPRTPRASVRAGLPAPLSERPSLSTIITAEALRYFTTRAHWPSSSIAHVSLHVLARAQSAYLFPSSASGTRKHVLSDAALIRWWQACLGRVAHASSDAGHVGAYYAIPGYSRLDSHALVPLTQGQPSGVTWHYGHPYTTRGAGLQDGAELPPLPLHAAAWEARRSLMPASVAPDRRFVATVIPVFPDDPKGRFFNEILGAAHEPGFGWTAPSSGAKLTHAQREAMAERHALDRVSLDSFWERLGFRQECSSGNAVGVFVVSVTARGERAMRAGSPHDSDAADARPDDCPTSVPTADVARRSMTPQSYALPHSQLEDIVLRHMMQDKCQWSSAAAATSLTRQWNEAIDRVLRRKAGATGPDDVSAGMDSVWCRVALRAVDKDVLAHAAKRAAPASAGSAAPIRVLSVKRQKRT